MEDHISCKYAQLPPLRSPPLARGACIAVRPRPIAALSGLSAGRSRSAGRSVQAALLEQKTTTARFVLWIN